MNYILEFSNFISKHKGPMIYPDIVYHKSNPIFRDSILKNGLIPQKGDSYSLHSPENNEPKAIFGYISKNNYEYDSTYDDDIYEIYTNKTNNEWFQDLQTSGTSQNTVVTYTSIPKEAIKLIYKGTGDSN